MRQFASKLAAYADVYCNNAFGTCHRAARVDGGTVPQTMGRASRKRRRAHLVDKEIRYLNSIARRPRPPVRASSSVARRSATNSPTIEFLLPKADHDHHRRRHGLHLPQGPGHQASDPAAVESERVDDLRRQASCIADAS